MILPTFVTVALIALASANPSVVKLKRDVTPVKRTPQYTTPPGCHADNVLRALRESKVAASASAFCSTYIQATIKTTATATLSSIIIVETTTPLATSTKLEIITNVETSTTTATPAVVFNKRQAVKLPPYVSQYRASEVSSACSCFIPLPSPATSIIQQSTTNIISDTSTAPTLTSTTTTLSTLLTTTTTTSTLPVKTCPAKRLGCVNSNFIVASSDPPTTNDCWLACAEDLRCKAFQYREVSVATKCNLLNQTIAIAYTPGTVAATGDPCNTAHLYDFSDPPC